MTAAARRVHAVLMVFVSMPPTRLLKSVGAVYSTLPAINERPRPVAPALPVMIAPKWLKSRCQPIGIDDAIRALAGAASLRAAREVDLAGPDIFTYRRMLEITSEEMRGRAPLMVAVPVLSPELSAHWLRLITRVDMKVARSLVSSLRHDMVAERPLLTTEAGIKPIGFRESVRIALGRD